MDLRLLLVNQGVMGTAVAGHAATENSLRIGLAAVDGLDARFVRLPPWSALSRAATLPVPGLAGRDLDAAGLRWLMVEGLRGRRTLRREIAATAPDVIHVNSHTAALLSVATMGRTPTLLAVDVPVVDWRLMEVWRPAGPRTADRMLAARRLERRAFRCAAAVIAYSEWAAAAVHRACPEARVRTIHPGLDVTRFRPGARRPRERPRVLFVGGRFRQKGGNDLLTALDDAIGHDVDVDIVTSERLAPRPGLQVHRLGSGEPRLLDLFQQADLLCLPTHGDASPWVVLEAMACATPVIGTPVGAIPETLGIPVATATNPPPSHPEAGGVLVPAGQPRELRAALERLLADPVALARLGRAGRARAERHYDARRQGPALVAVAREVANNRGNPPPNVRRPHHRVVNPRNKRAAAQ